jgi:hypothetical protein
VVRVARLWRGVAVSMLVAGVFAAPVPAVAETAPPTPPPGAEGREQVLDQLLPAESDGPGVTHRGFTTTESAGQVVGDIVQVDLTQPGVSIDLMNPGIVAGTETVKGMADDAGAVAGINGDFFDISATGAPAGPAVKGGSAVKAAVPQGRRAAPRVPGAEMDYVWSVGVDGVARIDRLPLTGEVSGPNGTLPIVGLNQYAVPINGIAVFTDEWGKDRAQTLCGSNDDPKRGCAPDTWEIAVRHGVVTGAGMPDGRKLAPDEIVLDGREAGGHLLKDYKIGDPIDVEYELTPASGVAPEAAVGGQPILVDGKPTEDLDDRIRAPRSAAGNSADGHTAYLVTVDGRQADSVGATLSEMSALMAQLGADDAVNLDGGGSSTLVFREPGQSTTSIVSDPSGTTARRVGDGLGVFVK